MKRAFTRLYSAASTPGVIANAATPSANTLTAGERVLYDKLKSSLNPSRLQVVDVSGYITNAFIN